jgi:hypothetical protein
MLKSSSAVCDATGFAAIGFFISVDEKQTCTLSVRTERLAVRNRTRMLLDDSENILEESKP